MKKSYRNLLLAIPVALLVLFFLLPDEEDKIVARLEQLRESSEITSPEPTIQQALTAKQLAELFSAPVLLDMTSMDLGVIRVDDPQQLTQGILKIRAALNLLELKMHDPRVTIDADRAEVELLGSALGMLRKSQQRFLEIHRILVFLRKTDDGWLITGARHIRNEQASPHD